MTAAIHGHRSKILLIIVGALVLAGLAIFIVLTLRSAPQRSNDGANSDNGPSSIDDTQPKPEKKVPSGDEKIPPKEGDKPPVNTPPTSGAVCTGGAAASSTFTIVLPAYAYMTAFEAKNKTNPALLYQSGTYFVYKCYDGIVNITHTQGVPGGWLDPNNPYQDPATPDVLPNDDPGLDSMTLDNTITNWSHEYPATFVKEYAGMWNISSDRLYLTFDCGYDYNNLASSIMDTLSSKGAKAVFFVTGDFMKDRPDLIRRMVNEGRVVGNHSYAHLNQPRNLDINTDTVVADIRAWEAAYYEIVGANPPVAYFRPPGGAVSRRSMALMDTLGYKTLMWGAAYRDWDVTAQPTRDVAMTTLRKYTTPGDIILLHGVSQTSNDILAAYIDEYRSKGFEFVLP